CGLRGEYERRVAPRRQLDQLRRGGRVVELVVVDHLSVANHHRAERQMPSRRNLDHLVRTAVLIGGLLVALELETFEPRAAAGENRDVVIRIDFDGALGTAGIRGRERRSLGSVSWCSTRRCRRGYRTSIGSHRTDESERLSLRLFVCLRLLELLLSRWRIKSFQHEFLIGYYQNNRQND